MSIEFGWTARALKDDVETKDDYPSFVSILNTLSKESTEQIVRETIRALIKNGVFSSKELQDIVKNEAKKIRADAKKTITNK